MGLVVQEQREKRGHLLQHIKRRYLLRAQSRPQFNNEAVSFPNTNEGPICADVRKTERTSVDVPSGDQNVSKTTIQGKRETCVCVWHLL